MAVYAAFIILSLTGAAVSGFLFFQVPDPKISFVSTTLCYIVSLLVMLVITKKNSEKEYNSIISGLKEEYKLKINRLKREYDTTTLEKTIRDGTRTLIKNAVDYFKIENIKNEMGNSAAIQNLQLDKYGQIIELLADFSLILPDTTENQEIVQEEINHQIRIYQMDEKNFSQFLQRIMEKYQITVNKKIREKKETVISARNMKICPKCAEKILIKAMVCKYCGHEFKIVPKTTETEWIKKGQSLYRLGQFQDALSFFTNALDSNPKSAQAYYSRAVTYEKLGNHSRALNDLTTAAQLGHKKAQELIHQFEMMDTQEWKTEQQ